AACNAKADEAGRARRHGACKLGLQGPSVTAANDSYAEARHDTRLESHPHHYNHSAPPPRAKLHTERYRTTVSAPEIAIASHRPERKESRVPVIAQIEYTRKAGRSVSLLRP